MKWPPALRMLALLCLLPDAAPAAPVRVSFLDTDAAREDTLRSFAEAGCPPANLATLRAAILRDYEAPLVLDAAAFPPATDGFREFASIGDFVAALGTNQLAYLPRDFGMNCFDAALLLAAPDMDLAVDPAARADPFFAVQVTPDFHERMVPVASLGEARAVAHPARRAAGPAATEPAGFPEKHRMLEAALYQFQPLPLGTTARTAAVETRKALQRHWQRCGIRFSDKIALVLLHRASLESFLAVTDHAGVRLRRDAGWLYLEKTGGRGPFLRIDVQDPADIAAYFSTMTWPDYPHNLLSVGDSLFLDVPLRSPAP